MQQIKLFFGSPFMRYDEERKTIEDFICALNHSFERLGIEIVLLSREYDNQSQSERLSTADEKMIADCDMCYFAFFDAADITKEAEKELTFAFEKFNEKQRPKAYLYFKSDISDSLIQETEWLHANDYYYSKFDTIDALKLKLLLSIAVHFESIKVGVKEGYCVINDKPVISLGNVSQFSNNSALSSLYDEFREVDEDYSECKARYESEKDNETLHEEYCKLKDDRESLKTDIDMLEKSIFLVSLQLAEDEANGKEFTTRERQAYDLFLQGDYEGSLELLSSDDDSEDSSEQEDADVYDRDFASKCIAIGTYYMQQSIPSEAEIYFIKGIEIWNQLAKENPGLNSGDLAISYFKTANFYVSINNVEKAEKCYLKAIKLFEDLSSQSPSHYNSYLAMSYNNLAAFYGTQNNQALSEEYLLKAIEIYEKLAAADPEKNSADLVAVYNNAAIFYTDQYNKKMAEAYYLKSVEVYEQLAECNPSKHNKDLAQSYFDLAAFYAYACCFDESEAYYLKAKALYEQLAEENYEFNVNVANIYANLGNVYKCKYDTNQAELSFLKALALYEKLAEKNPDYNGGLASVCNNFGLFYMNHDAPEKAEIYYHKAIKIRKQLASETPAENNPALARTYFNACLLYMNQGESSEAESYARQAIELYTELAQADPDQYSSDLNSSLVLLSMVTGK